MLPVAGIPPPSNGIVMNCCIPDADGVVWMPNSRCNCSKVNTIPLGVVCLLNNSETLTFATFGLVVGGITKPSPPLLPEAVSNKQNLLIRTSIKVIKHKITNR